MSSVAMPESTLRALAALPVATDEEAEAVTPPKLGLTDADITRLHALAEAVAEARAAAIDAEQAHTRATHQALRLPELQRRAGEVSTDQNDRTVYFARAKHLMARVKRSIDNAKRHAGG